MESLCQGSTGRSARRRRRASRGAGRIGKKSRGLGCVGGGISAIPWDWRAKQAELGFLLATVLDPSEPQEAHRRATLLERAEIFENHPAGNPLNWHDSELLAKDQNPARPKTDLARGQPGRDGSLSGKTCFPLAAGLADCCSMPSRLATEKSPYLRQHADNPVDWFPWARPRSAWARAEGKPLFLSIGYSACHWCRSDGARIL